jgi:hypothetical protein
VLLVVMLVGTVGFFELVPGWLPTSGEFVVTDRFHDWQQDWRATGGAGVRSEPDGGLRVESLSATSHAGIERAFPYPAQCGHIQVVSEIGLDGVVSGDQLWQRARIVVARRTALEGWAMQSDPALVFQGTMPIGRHEAVLTCPRQQELLHLRIELHQVTGRMTLRSVSLQVVEENSIVVYGRRLGAVLWCVFGLLVVRRFGAEIAASIGNLPALALGLLILVGVLLPVPLRDAMLVLIGLGNPFGAAPSASWGHALLFALLAAVLQWRSGQQRGWHVAAVLITLAFVSEALQYLAPGREPSVFDLLVDWLGIATGLAVAMLLRRRRGCLPAPS